MKKEELENMLDNNISLEEFLKSTENTGNVNAKINLPEGLTIGIEIESEGEFGKLIYRMTNMLEDGWECKRRKYIIKRWCRSSFSYITIK